MSQDACRGRRLALPLPPPSAGYVRGARRPRVTPARWAAGKLVALVLGRSRSAQFARRVQRLLQIDVERPGAEATARRVEGARPVDPEGPLDEVPQASGFSRGEKGKAILSVQGTIG